MAAGDTLQGRRLKSVSQFYDHDKRQPGDYVKVDRSGGGHVWYICDPLGKVGGLYTHTVEEHDDGTITVSPSILDPDEGGWHGYLERGVWREV